jgi:hypothetical protein
MGLISEIGDIDRFSTARQLMAHLGLVAFPSTKGSLSPLARLTSYSPPFGPPHAAAETPARPSYA